MLPVEYEKLSAVPLFLSVFIGCWLEQLSLLIFIQVFTATLLILFAHTCSTTSQLILLDLTLL